MGKETVTKSIVVITGATFSLFSYCCGMRHKEDVLGTCFLIVRGVNL